MSERQYVHMHLIQCFIDLCVVVSKVRESRFVAASDVKGRDTGMKCGFYDVSTRRLSKSAQISLSREGIPDFPLISYYRSLPRQRFACI